MNLSKLINFYSLQIIIWRWFLVFLYGMKLFLKFSFEQLKSFNINIAIIYKPVNWWIFEKLNFKIWILLYLDTTIFSINLAFSVFCIFLRNGLTHVRPMFQHCKSIYKFPCECSNGHWNLSIDLQCWKIGLKRV